MREPPPHTDGPLKTRLDDLAIFGGPPAFVEARHVGRPNIGDRDRLRARIDDLLDRRWLTNDGPLVREFEQRIAALLGVEHCVAVANGTVALELVIRALGLTGEVILPSFTFIATAHALEWHQIKPVFCDIEPATHNIDPDHVEQLITPRTSAIVGVHLWGRPCDVGRLTQIAESHRLELIFDAAHALGCTTGGRSVGGFGQAEVFSFHATKFINTFEGGAITTADADLAARLRLMRNFGFADYDQVARLGINAKLTEVAAAMGLTNLESIDDFIAHNRRNHEDYRHCLRDLTGVSLLAHDECERSNYQYIVAEIDAGRSPLSRDQLVRLLWSENVRARRYFFPGCHRSQPYFSRDPSAAERLPITELVSSRVLLLPTGSTISRDAIERIGAVLRIAFAHAGEVAARLDETV
jgi:dTDP-4-amino-4,6-dideoxygalactose transaminase